MRASGPSEISLHLQVLHMWSGWGLPCQATQQQGNRDVRSSFLPSLSPEDEDPAMWALYLASVMDTVKGN